MQYSFRDHIDRRQDKRRHLAYNVSVFNRKTGDLLGHMIDVSRSGIKLVNEDKIPPGREMTMRMALPEKIRGKSYIDFTGKSVWSAEDDNPDYFDTGFKITKVRYSDLVVVDHMIELYGYDM